MESEHGCAVLAGEAFRSLQRGLCDAVSPGCRVHGKGPPARPSARPAQTLGCGVGVEGAGSSHDAVDLGDDQRAVPRVQLEVEQILEIAVVGVGSDGGLVLLIGRKDDCADGWKVVGFGEPDPDAAARRGLLLAHRE